MVYNLSLNRINPKNILQTNPIKSNLSFQGNIKPISEDSFIKSKNSNTSPEKAQTKILLKEAIKAFNSEHYQRSILILERMLENDPESALGWHCLASSQKQLGQLKDAIESYSFAIELNPNSANSLKLRADTKIKLAASENEDKEILYSDALRDYERSLDIKESTQVRDSQISLLIKLKKYDRAIESLDKAIELCKEKSGGADFNKKMANYHYLKGISLFASARNGYSETFEKAKEEFTTALNYAPNSEKIYYQRARTNYRLNSDEAKQDIECAININDQNSKYWKLYSKILLQSENPNEVQLGIDCLAQAVSLENQGK